MKHKIQTCILAGTVEWELASFRFTPLDSICSVPEFVLNLQKMNKFLKWT